MSEVTIQCYEVVQYGRNVAHLHNYIQFCAWGRIIPIRTFSLDYWQSTSFPHSLMLHDYFVATGVSKCHVSFTLYVVLVSNVRF